MKNLISALLIFLPFIGLSQYKPMNQPYQFNSQTKFTDTVFLDTAMQGQGVYLVMDTLTGEVKRDTISAGLTPDSVLTIVRANVDTSGTLNLQQVTDNGATTTNEIVLSSLQASGSGGLTLQSSGNNSVFTVGGGGGTNATFFGNVNMSNNRILNVPDKPTDSTDAVNLNLVDSLILQTDTFRFDSAQLVGLGTGEDTLLTTTTGKFIDVISLSVVGIGGTAYTGILDGELRIKSENGLISQPEVSVLTSAGTIFKKSLFASSVDLGEYVIFDIQGSSGLSGGNKNLAIVVHYKIITI